jgi:hypothetical protein
MATTPPPEFVQSASNSICRYQQRNLTATFDDTTQQNSLLVLKIVAGGGGVTVDVPSGWIHIRTAYTKGVQLSMWYYPAAPAMDSVTITARDDRSLQIRVTEYKGAAQNNVLDQVVVATDESDECHSGTTGITAQPDEIVVAAVANAYTSCSQSGFSGGLIRLFETLSPQRYGNFFRYFYNDDSDRTRFTYHHLIVRIQTFFFLRCFLTSRREWVAILVTFRGGSTGPKQMSSKLGNPVLNTGGGHGQLNAFGPLASTKAPPVLTNPVGTARIYPFEYQYLVGPQGLLIGSHTQYHVQETNGLYGWSVRSSDNDLPRDIGAQRGIDLESARIVTFTMEVGKGRDLVELNMEALFRALVPQRDADWPLIWRHPDAPPKLMYCRPTDINRVRNNSQLQFHNQTFALRAADPRHYSAVPKRVIIPNTPAGATTPTTVNVTNEGNVPAYPVITVVGPTSGPSVSRVTLSNLTGLVIFDVQLILPNKSVLIGDMKARVTGASTSPITLDGQSKYGAWQLPREPFRIDPDPLGRSGFNVLSLQTVPAGAPVTCTLDYRDTWAG